MFGMNVVMNMASNSLYMAQNVEKQTLIHIIIQMGYRNSRDN